LKIDTFFDSRSFKKEGILLAFEMRKKKIVQKKPFGVFWGKSGVKLDYLSALNFGVPGSWIVGEEGRSAGRI